MTRRLALAALTFAALALLASPAAAHEGAATVDCDRATFTAVGFGDGAHTVGAVLTVSVGASDEPTLVDLPPQTLDGDAGTVSWDVAGHTDRPGLLDLLLAVSWDAHGGGTTTASASHVCVEPATTTTGPTTTTTSGVPVTVATTAVPATTTTDVPPAADDAGPPELPRTGDGVALAALGVFLLAAGVFVYAMTRERAR